MAAMTNIKDTRQDVKQIVEDLRWADGLDTHIAEVGAMLLRLLTRAEKAEAKTDELLVALADHTDIEY